MRYRMGDLVERVTEVNSDLKYGLNDIVGVTLEKQMIPTIANLTQTNLDNFIIVHPKDFVYNPRTHGKKIGLGFNTTDRCFITTWNNNTFRVKSEMSNVIMPEYLYMHFLREKWDKEACFNAWGSSTVVLLWSSFCDMKINVPSLPEQRKIVHDYQVITNRIELLRKMNENLEEQASLHFESVFGRYIPDGLNVSSTIPDGWTVATIGDFCKANSATFSGKEDVLLYLDTGSITNNYISGLQTLNTNTDKIPSRARRKVSNGDIVYSTVRPNLRHYGIIFNPPVNMIVSTGFAVMSMIKNAPVCSEFIYMWLTRNSVVNVLNSIAENSVSTYPSIVSADLEQIKMIVPSEDERAETGAYYKSVLQTIDCNNREISKLERLAMLFSNQLAKGA